MNLKMKPPIAAFNVEGTAFCPSQVRELSGMTRDALIRLAVKDSDPERTERLVRGHHLDGLYHFATVPLDELQNTSHLPTSSHCSSVQERLVAMRRSGRGMGRIEVSGAVAGGAKIDLRNR